MPFPFSVLDSFSFFRSALVAYNGAVLSESASDFEIRLCRPLHERLIIHTSCQFYNRI